MALLSGRAGRLTAKNGGFRPGQYLLDCILEQKQARAIGSEALRAVVPFLWEAYGFRYAMQEWALYTSLFLTPLAVFCIRLCFAGARDDAHGDAIAISALAMAVVWVLRQLYGEVKQCAAAKHDGQGILATIPRRCLERGRRRAPLPLHLDGRTFRHCPGRPGVVKRR